VSFFLRECTHNFKYSPWENRFYAHANWRLVRFAKGFLSWHLAWRTTRLNNGQVLVLLGSFRGI
jgi:hypothetical protein